MTLNKKAILKEENRKQINYFPLSDRNTLTLQPTSHIPGRLYARTKMMLSKVEERLSTTSKLGFIYNLDDHREKIGAENKELRPNADSFYWQTTQKQIQHAVDYGITEFSALTSKVIGAVGAYRLLVLERVYDNGIISNKYEHKEMLLRITQTRIRNLQGLERLTNAYDLGASVDDNTKRILDTFEDYIVKMQQLQTDITTHLTILTEFDRAANQTLVEQIHRDIEKAREYQRQLSAELQTNKLSKQRLENQALAATGPKSIVNFMKMRMIYALREAQAHNQNMTFSRKAKSFSRGQFNSYCEDALKLVDAHQADHHNPTLPEHQGYYSTNENDAITLDYQRLGKNRRTTRQYLMAISNIEGADAIAQNADGHYVIISGDSITHNLKTTRFTAWDRQSERFYHPKRILSWGWNVLSGIVVGVIVDLPLGFILGLAGVELVSISTKLRVEFNPVCENETWFKKFARKMDFPVLSLGSRVGKLLGNLLRNTVWEMLKGVATTVKQASLHIGENLTTDYEIGHKGLPNEKEIYATVLKDLDKLAAKKSQIKKELKPLFTSSIEDSDKEFGKIKTSELISRYAAAPYELSPGEWNDLTNAVLNGIKSMVETITHEIHAKHPFAGLLFTTFYFLGGIIILSPKTLSFMGTYYLRFSQAIAIATSKNTTLGATSSAFYQAELSSLIPEFIVDGRNSWIAKGLTSLEDEPSNMMIYAALAIGLGSLLTYGINIPYLSESIRNDLGTVPVIALAATGAKFGILLVELLKAEGDENDLNIGAKREKLRLFITEHYKAQYQLTAEQIESGIDVILSGQLPNATLTHAKEEIQRLEFMMILQRQQELLPHLPYRSKRLLVELVRKQDRHQFSAAAMSQLVFPEKQQSIFEVTVSTILLYFPILGRCLTTIVTWDKEPWRFLAEKIHKDLSRVANAISGKIINGIAHHFRVVIRGLFDVVVNEVFARVEGFIRNDAHSLSRGTYKVSSGVDSTYETAKEFLAQPVDALRKAATKPHPTSFLQRIMHKFRYGLFNKVAKFPVEEPVVAPEVNKLHFNPKVLQNELKNPGPTSQLRQFTVPQLLQFAASDPESYPAMLRYILKSRTRREQFIQNDCLFNDKNRVARDNRYYHIANNPLYFYLKHTEFNYELLRDLIRNLPLRQSEIVNLMCLDRSGNIAIDFLTKQFDTQKSRRFFNDSFAISSIIKHYYANQDVLIHLQPNHQFGLALANAFKELAASNLSNALYMLAALTDNLSTQPAMADYFSQNPQWFHTLAITQEDQHRAITHLASEFSKLANLKPDSPWPAIAVNLHRAFAPAPNLAQPARTQPVSLFTTPTQEKYRFFSNHQHPLNLHLETEDFEVIDFEADSQEEESDDAIPYDY